MSKNETSSSKEVVTIITAIIGAIATITVAYFTYRSIVVPKELEISATQTAESLKAAQIATSSPSISTNTSGDVIAETPTPISSPVTLSDYFFEDGCINKNTWSLLQGNTAPENNNCWSLDKKGIYAAQGTGLSINIVNSPSSRIYGLVTAITSDTDISFDMNISELTTVSSWNTNVAIGLLPSATSTPNQDGTSILFQSGEQGEPIWMLLEIPDTEQIYLPPPRISTNRVYNVKLEIRGTRMTTYLDYEIVDERNLSGSHPFLWVGYTVAQGGALSVTLENFSLVLR